MPPEEHSRLEVPAKDRCTPSASERSLHWPSPPSSPSRHPHYPHYPRHPRYPTGPAATLPALCIGPWHPHQMPPVGHQAAERMWRFMSAKPSWRSSGRWRSARFGLEQTSESQRCAPPHRWRARPRPRPMGSSGSPHSRQRHKLHDLLPQSGSPWGLRTLMLSEPDRLLIWLLCIGPEDTTCTHFGWQPVLLQSLPLGETTRLWRLTFDCCGKPLTWAFWSRLIVPSTAPGRC